MHAHPPRGARLQIAEVFQRFAAPYRRRHCLSAEASRVLDDLERCRTAALGVHPYRCDDCGRDVPLFNSCLNRHCPTCQGPAQHRWIEAREQRLLNTPYFHCVFTLPAILRPIVLAHRRELLGLLFRAVSQTLLAFAADPKWLGAHSGFSLVLHTWTREMLFHPHLHAIVAGGGLSADGSQWTRPPSRDFLFPVAAISKVFRGRFLEGLIDLCNAGQIDLAESDCRKLVRTAKRSDWVVYTKRAFGGPDHVVRYLGRYTHRVAISSARLLSITDHRITFRTRGDKTCSLAPDEFLRRLSTEALAKVDAPRPLRQDQALRPARTRQREDTTRTSAGTPRDPHPHRRFNARSERLRVAGHRHARRRTVRRSLGKGRSGSVADTTALSSLRWAAHLSAGLSAHATASAESDDSPRTVAMRLLSTIQLAQSALLPVPSHRCAHALGFRHTRDDCGRLLITRWSAAQDRFRAARRIDTRTPEPAPFHLAMSGQFHTYGRRRDIPVGSAA